MVVWLALTIVGLVEHWPAWLDAIFAYLTGAAITGRA
jgi:hypothetical protein